MEEPVKKYQRLYPGNEVRIKSAYIVKCTGCKKDENGNVVEVYAEYDPETKGGNTPDGRKVRGTIHWVDANNCLDAEVRLYDNLFTVPDPDTGDRNFLDYLNENSLEVSQAVRLKRILQAQRLRKAISLCATAISALTTRTAHPNTSYSTAV